MKKIGLYVDVSNLYFCLCNNQRGKLNYSELVTFLDPLGNIIIRKAYGAQIKDEATQFIQSLQNLGFIANYKAPKTYGNVTKADWDVGIAVDIIKDLEHLDMIIIATADGDMCPLVQYILEHGKDAVIIGSGISKELQRTATKCIEIPASLVVPFRRK